MINKAKNYIISMLIMFLINIIYTIYIGELDYSIGVISTHLFYITYSTLKYLDNDFNNK